jgi:hypothetical protein
MKSGLNLGKLIGKKVLQKKRSQQSSTTLPVLWNLSSLISLQHSDAIDFSVLATISLSFTHVYEYLQGQEMINVS